MARNAVGRMPDLLSILILEEVRVSLRMKPEVSVDLSPSRAVEGAPIAMSVARTVKTPAHTKVTILYVRLFSLTILFSGMVWSLFRGEQLGIDSVV